MLRKKCQTVFKNLGFHEFGKFTIMLEFLLLLEKKNSCQAVKMSAGIHSTGAVRSKVIYRSIQVQKSLWSTR